MSSVSSSASSRTVGTADRLLHPLGRKADDDSSGATFAVKAAIAAQGPDPDAPSPADEVVVTIEAADADAATVEAAHAARPALPDVNAADETTSAASSTDSGAPAARAAHAYAQTMQALLDAKISRVLAARRAAKSDHRTDR